MGTFGLKTNSPLINVMTAAVEKAARGIIRDFGELEHLQVSRKSLGDFVSAADHRSENILIEELSRSRPGFGFIAEESGIIEGKDPDHTWIIDPLDGTTNFLHSVPHFAVTIALKVKNEIIAGVTYDPIQDELFWAEKGRGAFMNQRRLRVSARRTTEEALVGIGAPYGHHGNPVLFQERLNKVLPHTSGVRRMGSAALDLAYVAAGRFDVFFEEPMFEWDYAAGIIMVQEAGGVITQINGAPLIPGDNNVLAGNPDIHNQTCKLLQ